MIGAVAGDMIGAPFEFWSTKSMDFSLFRSKSKYTDDTVLTMAVANAILEDGDYGESLRRFGRKYPLAGYGPKFFKWLFNPFRKPYNSWGNGSAMRVSPVGFAFDSEEAVLEEAKKTADPTHNHREGVKGAQATALAIYLARTGNDKDVIRETIAKRFEYDLSRSVDGIRPRYRFDVSCQGSVPESIICFLESSDYEDAVRKAVSLGGDSDTMACIAGGIAQAFYGGVPGEIVTEVRKRQPESFLDIIDTFTERFGVA